MLIPNRSRKLIYALGTTTGFLTATGWKPTPGLYTCGEIVGGLFHYNYPLGTGLMSGAVFGRIAAKEAMGGKVKGKTVKKAAPKKVVAKRPVAKKAAKPAKKAVKRK